MVVHTLLGDMGTSAPGSKQRAQQGWGGAHLGPAQGRDCRQVLCLGARGLSVQNGARRLRCFLQRSENKCNANAGEWEAAGSRVSQTGVQSQAEAGPIWSLQSGSREDSRHRAGDPGEAGEGGSHGGQPELPSSGRVCSQGCQGTPQCRAGKPSPAREPRRLRRDLSSGW